MDTYLIDYSASKLSAAVIKATAVGPAGEHPSGVIRYIDAPNRLGTKHTNLAEYEDHVRNGLVVHLFFEVDTSDPLGGYAQGQAYAQRAKAGADYLGYNGVIFFCCDRWMANQPSIPVSVWQAYLDGAVSVLGRGRVGAYGFGDAMDAARGHVDYFVQCGARSVVRPFVHIWQDNNTQPPVGGIQTDRLLVLKPITTTQENDLNADQDAALHQILNQVMGPWPSYVNPNVKLTLVDYARAADERGVQQSTQISSLIALLGKQSGVTAEQIAAALQPGLTAAVLPAIESALTKALGSDNAAQAATVAHAVVAELAANLATPAAPAV